MFKLAVLVSGGGTNLQAIIDRIADRQLRDVVISGVIASRPGIGACERANRAGLSCLVIQRSDYSDPSNYDQAMLTALAAWQPDLVVLAGFLSLLGPEVVAAYRGRIINVHPALIPSFCGKGFYGIRVHEAVIASGVKVSGATVHLVDERYDHGPILLQKAIDVRPDDTARSLQLRVMQECEQILLPQAIALFAAGKVQTDGTTAREEEDLS
ncbi:MAG: phosphoribosylglycinamide formyltransferase [Eubacteriales bacterium]|nr:phosphoribosylglycinamide formyltransferase [Eubacteriales bacterium]